VERVAGNHPAANMVPLQTGVYWIITPQGCTSGFSATLTLPFPNPDSSDKLCRYSGSGWHCAADSFALNVFDAGLGTVTREGISAFSDWVVGDNAGPTAVALTTFKVQSGPFSGLVWAAIVGGLLFLSLGLFVGVMVVKSPARSGIQKSTFSFQRVFSRGDDN